MKGISHIEKNIEDIEESTTEIEEINKTEEEIQGSVKTGNGDVSNYRATGVGQIVWGLILDLLDLRINGIDLLPDFIGYILIVVGLGSLLQYSIHFAKAHKVAMPLIVLTFMSLYEIPKTHFLALESMPLSLTLMFLGGLMIIVKLFMIYYICQGMIELTDREETMKDFSDLIKRRWRNYLFINGVFQVLAPFALNVSEETMLFVLIPGILIAMIMEILMINLIHRFGKEVLSRSLSENN